MTYYDEETPSQCYGCKALAQQISELKGKIKKKRPSRW